MGSPHTAHQQALRILRDHGPLSAEEFAPPALAGAGAQDALVAASLLAHLIDHGYVICLEAGAGTGFALTARGREAAGPPAATPSPAGLIPTVLLLATFLPPTG